MTANTKGGLLQRATKLIAETTPKFSEWTAKNGFRHAGILTPYKTGTGAEFYVMTESTGFNSKTIASSISFRDFWNGKLSKAFEWQCFSKDFNELSPFLPLFDDQTSMDMASLYFLPFNDKETPMIFVLAEFSDEEQTALPQSSACASMLKKIVEYKRDEQRELAEIDESIEKGLEISSAHFFILSLKNSVEKLMQNVEIERKLSKIDMVDRIELKARITAAVTSSAYATIAPLFKSPNCIHVDETPTSGDMKIVLFAKDELDEKLLSFHIVSMLQPLLGEHATKHTLLLSAGICPIKKGAVAFLQNG